MSVSIVEARGAVTVLDRAAVEAAVAIGEAGRIAPRHRASGEAADAVIERLLIARRSFA